MTRLIFTGMFAAKVSKAAFIRVTATVTLADVNRIFKALEEQGFRCVFPGEATQMASFIERTTQSHQKAARRGSPASECRKASAKHW